LSMFRTPGFILTVVIAIAVATSATAADRIRLAVQRTGTLAWELDVIRTHGLDRKLDLAVETVEFASTEAGKIALKGGSADLMLSDWLWVARERALGAKLVYYPYSSTLGAVMAPASSGITGIADLKGKKIAVEQGTVDHYLLLLALEKNLLYHTDSTRSGGWTATPARPRSTTRTRSRSAACRASTAPAPASPGAPLRSRVRAIR